MTQTSSILNRRALLRAIAASAALAASTAIAGCSTGEHPPARRSEPGALVMIIRHGEKPDKSSPLPGVDINGRPGDKYSLTEVGWNRARGLVGLFDPPGPLRHGLARPTLIYAASAHEGDSGVRTRETVTPLAQKLGIPLNTDFGAGDEEEMAAEITLQTGPTLICWHHDEIPVIARAFGTVTPTPPAAWPDDRFDVVWVLTANGSGWDFAQLAEMVLPGDRNQTITG